MAEHPITPPPELVEQWLEIWPQDALDAAARWGADQELEACVEWIARQDWTWTSAQLRRARRPKPPSLKQQALDALQRAEEGWRPIPDDCDTIRRALEQLND